MRRTHRTMSALACLGALIAGLLAAPASGAGEPATVSPYAATSGPGAGARTDEEAKDALARASQIFAAPQAARPTRAESSDPSLALRDLFDVLPRLTGDDRALAERILARPTDGSADPQGDGYETSSVRRCASEVCVHWVRSTRDAPPNDAWARKNLQVMQRVYDFEVNRLGYRKPAPEPNQPGTGGNGKFDVYLKDIGLGIFGYCAPEYRVPGRQAVASGYCVLDNDFARSEFGADPVDSLRVTAAHEFFHAIQFGYDYTEDPWLLESTAAWMEERFADGVNDNRRYLPRSQVRVPHAPLDLFETNGTYHYGQWAFWEFLSQRKGNRIVREMWNRAAEKPGGRNPNSLNALRGTLSKKGGLTRNFAAYAAANTMPARNYAEGRTWPSSRLTAVRTVERGKRRFRTSYRVSHLASRSVSLRPGGSLRNNKWKLRVAVNGPNRSTSPGAFVTVVRKRGGLVRRPVSLNRKGYGRMKVPFSARSIRRIVVTTANVSTRTRCDRGTDLACQGQPRDQNRRFTVKTAAIR